MTDDPSPPYGPERKGELIGAHRDESLEYPVSFEGLREAAEEALDPDVRGYLAGGAGEDDTVRENRRAFERWRIQPRMCRDTSRRDLRVDLFDGALTLPVPVALAPIGMQSVFHEEGELAAARAAREVGVPMCLSSVAGESIEDVGAELDAGAPNLFQLYPSTDREVMESFVRRAEAADFDAVVVTVDTPISGWRGSELDRGYVPGLDGNVLMNYLTDPVVREKMDVDPEENPETALGAVGQFVGDLSLTWADVDWIAELTDLPVVVKGILHPDDAREAAARTDGVVVSNHGGRQIDGEIAALDALPGVAEAARQADADAAVLFDSGVRSGADVVRALALGADAVMIGRPYIYGLTLGGQAGVEHVLRNLLGDLDLALALAGFADVGALDRDAVVDRSRLP